MCAFIIMIMSWIIMSVIMVIMTCFIIMMFYPIVWGNVIISLTLRTFYTQRKLVTKGD